MVADKFNEGILRDIPRLPIEGRALEFPLSCPLPDRCRLLPQDRSDFLDCIEIKLHFDSAFSQARQFFFPEFLIYRFSGYAHGKPGLCILSQNRYANDI